MKTLLLATLFFSLQVSAETFIVEMKKPLTQVELEAARQKGVQIALFDNSQSDYFQRTYKIENAQAALIESQFPVRTLERVHRAQYFSLEPKSNSVFLRPDSLFHMQWGLFNQGQKVKKLINNSKEVTMEGNSGSDIRWSEAIKKVEVGLKKDPLVAVVDMGIDYNHPDLKDRIFRNKAECNEKGEIADLDEDKDKNGLKGDCMGWNFAARNMFEARRPYDDDGHGTHVAGIIAAESNKEGISGVSSRIKILPVKVTGKIDETADRKSIQPLTDRIAKGILYAANMGADVINLSLGWTRSMDTKYLNEALQYALNRGVIIVAAAGNNNNNASIFPCSHYDVICVGAATIDGSLADFSNYGGEVDVLAPGDEIISTIPLQAIPLQLNLQGYDVRSGTSQAAPFVSAIAALLRGNFPWLHPDEVTRRIVDSADAGIPGKSLGGMVNLKGAFEIAPVSGMRPVFKNFSVALYDGPTNKFLYPLMVKNFGFEAKDVIVKVRSKSPSFKMEQDYKIPLLRPGEVITLRIAGDILDPYAHNQVKIEVEMEGSNFSQKKFQHEFRIARDILKDKNVETVAFEYQADALPLGIMTDGSVRNIMNSVETIGPQVGLPEFYLSRVVKETNSIEIRLLRGEDGKLKEVSGLITLPQATQLLNVMKLDVDYDGVEDYLIRTIACEKNCEDADKALRHIQYSVWKRDLTPAFGEKSFWKFLPTLVNVDIKSQRFLKIQTKDFGEIAVPAFIETGVIPQNQQEQGPFLKPDLSIARRIYFLEPQVNAEGKVEFITQTISTAGFLKGIRETLGMSNYEEVQTLHLLTQKPEELKNGKVQALFSVGKGYLRKNFVLTLGQENDQIKPFQIAQNLWGFEHTPSLNLATQTADDSFNGLVSRSRMVMFQTSLNSSYSYNAQNTVEVPLSVIGAFKDEGHEYTFFQTASYLMAAHHTASGVNFSRLKINRFSFLPGALFNDTFYPVIGQNGNKFIPALYVDETDIQSNLVSLTVLDEGTLKTPIKFSAFIPPICKAMNPNRLENDEGHSFSLLCLENRQWVMKFIKLN